MKDKICVCFLCFLGIVSAAVLKCGSPVCVELQYLIFEKSNKVENEKKI